MDNYSKGIKCSVCGEVIKYSAGGALYEYKEHSNLLDCVKFLAIRIKDLEMDVFDLNKKVF